MTTRLRLSPPEGRLRRASFAPEAWASFAARADALPLLMLKRQRFRDDLIRAMAQALGPDVTSFRSLMRDRACGAMLLDLGGDRPDVWLEATVALGGLLGPLRVHLATGACHEECTLSHEQSLSERRSKPSAYRPERMHTDGHASPERRDDYVLLLIAERTECVGGRSLLLHLDDWPERERFASSPWAASPLRFVVSPEGAVPRDAPPSDRLDVVRAPVFFDLDGGACVRFAEEFMHPDEPAHLDFVAEMGRSLDRAAWPLGQLAPGQVLAMNNRFWFHGRERFAENVGLRRRLARVRGRFGEGP